MPLLRNRDMTGLIHMKKMKKMKKEENTKLS